MTKQEELKQWRELARKATAGPWEVDGDEKRHIRADARVVGTAGNMSCAIGYPETERRRSVVQAQDDAAYLAFSSPDRVLEMLERVEAAEAAVREAALQIAYLHEKFGETGSGNAVLAKLTALGASADGK